jgi:hypothetical protein
LIARRDSFNVIRADHISCPRRSPTFLSCKEGCRGSAFSSEKTLVGAGEYFAREGKVFVPEIGGGVLLHGALKRGGWPRLLILRALPTHWVPRSFAFFAKGGSRKCRRQLGLITCPQQNQTAHAASPPILAKNARMGHPLWEWWTQRSLKWATRPPFIEPGEVQQVPPLRRR